MKNKTFSKSVLIGMIMISISSAGKAGKLAPDIKEENVSYSIDGVTYKGFIAYDDNVKGKRPAILDCS